MWYIDKITVKQNDVCWVRTGNPKHGKDKIDKQEYEFKGQLGAWFESLEWKEPRIGDNRWIYETEFSAWKVYPKKRFWFFTIYQVWWTPVQGQNTPEEIREFYFENMLKTSLPQNYRKIKD